MTIAGDSSEHASVLRCTISTYHNSRQSAGQPLRPLRTRTSRRKLSFGNSTQKDYIVFPDNESTTHHRPENRVFALACRFVPFWEFAREIDTNLLFALMPHEGHWISLVQRSGSARVVVIHEALIVDGFPKFNQLARRSPMRRTTLFALLLKYRGRRRRSGHGEAPPFSLALMHRTQCRMHNKPP